MTAQTMQIGNKPCRIYGGANAEYLLLQMTGEHELQSMDYEVAAIAQSSQNFLFAAIPVESWGDTALSDGAGHSHTGAAVSSPGKRQNHSGRLLAGRAVRFVGIHPDRFVLRCRRRFSLCVVSGLDGV